jgi:outer membrane protein
MKKPVSISVSLFLMLICDGCYVNHAVVDPYSYGPPSSSDFWTPPAKMQNPQAKLPDKPVIPDGDNPVSLAELLDIALINNTNTRQTWAQAREAAAQYGQSQSTAFPSLTGSYTFERIRQGSYFTSSGNDVQSGQSGPTQAVFITLNNQWGPQLALSYTIFDFGQRRATSEAARQALYFADYTHNRAIETLIQTITNDYYNYLYQQQLQDAYQANVQTAQTTLDAADLGFQTGVNDVSDVLQARTQLLQNEMQYVGQKQQVQNSFADLLNDMGIPANMDFSVVPMPTDLPPEEQFPHTDDLIVVALENRPDYLAAKANAESKRQSLKAAKRQLWPTINYNLNFGRTNYTGGLTDKYDYTSAFSLNLPIFSGYYYLNNIKIAQANLEQAQAELEQTELDVVRDITTYRYNVKIAYETLRYAKNYLAAADEQYRVALAEYKAGTTSILDVVSAQSSLADARAQQANAIQGWYSSLANLTYAIGIASKPSLTSEDKSE